MLQTDKILLAVVVMLTTSDVLAFGENMSTFRLGKTRLMEDLRAHSAFKDKISPCGEDNTVNLTFQYRHYDVLTIDEVQQSVTSIGSLMLSWVDSQLTWNKANYGGVDLIAIPYDEIWHPTIIVSNAADQDFLRIDKMDTLTLSSNGTITYITPVYLKTTCNLDLKYYPFDIQICYIMFQPFVDDVNYNIYSESIGETQDYILISGEWRILYKTIATERLNYLSLQVIRFTMKIQRSYMYYVVCVLAPMVLTSSMISIVFWIPPHSGEKVSFLVTLFASIAVFLNFIAGTLPRNITQLPLVTVFLLFVSLQCIVAIIATVIVIRRFEREQQDMLETHTDAISQQTDQKNGACNSKGNNVTEIKVTPGGPSRLTTDGLGQYLFRKFAFFRSRVVPSERSQSLKGDRTKKRRGRCYVTASTLDIIFFFLFHLASLPIYYLLFEISM